MVAKVARRNGTLIYRPDWASKRLVEVGQDQRFEDCPIGSHILKTDWLHGRAHWKDENQKPWPAHWERSEEIRKLEEIAEADYTQFRT